MTARPKAAVGTFPYPHRTIAELDAISASKADKARMAAKAREDAALSARWRTHLANNLHWCDQCQRKVSGIGAAVCTSQFCSLKAVAA